MDTNLKYKIYAQRVFTRQWTISVDFYSKMLELPVKFSSEEMGWAEFDLSGASLAVERYAESEDPQHLVGRFVGISIQVDDIDAVYSDLSKKGVEFTTPPERQPWGGVLAHFKDPDGNVLTFLGQ